MKIHYLRAACIAIAAAFLASSANAQDIISIISATNTVRIVDGPNSINLSDTLTALTGATTSVSDSGFIGTNMSSFPESATFSTTANFEIPLSVGTDFDSVMRATSEVRFTADQDLTLTAFGIGAGAETRDGAVNGVVMFSGGSNTLVVRTLYDVTADEVLVRDFADALNPPGTIDGVAPGPAVTPDIVAVLFGDGILLQAGNEYTYTFEQESRLAANVPNIPGLIFDGAVASSGRSNISFATVVPEPTTCVLLSLAMVGLAFRRRRTL